ncbi:hypothetical protein EYF80_041327 [Liparis tanakae]|uniref:Uncharacterized protein n=1 Tax=Liparis tanakae TaxID=230148 RepID=A0A4Z2G6D6_9TELE|nr:hypothetical protein EYF80_041327 [Liparis tanakae]
MDFTLTSHFLKGKLRPASSKISSMHLLLQEDEQTQEEPVSPSRGRHGAVLHSGCVVHKIRWQEVTDAAVRSWCRGLNAAAAFVLLPPELRPAGRRRASHAVVETWLLTVHLLHKSFTETTQG